MIAVIGGGPAGAIAARELARAGRAVVLVDRPSNDGPRIGESLPAAGGALLERLGLGAILRKGVHEPAYGKCSAWGSPGLVTEDAIRDPHGPGWRLDRRRFDAELRQAALDAGAQFRAAAVGRIARDGAGWQLALDGEKLQASILIDATGRGALVARGQGARRLREDDLVAIHAWIGRDAGDVDTRTLIEAAPTGWWYTAALPGQARVVVFHTGAGHARRLLRSPDAWRAELAQTTYIRRRASAAAEARLNCREAGGSRLDRFHGEGWLAAGDAALAFDPLSSQGIFNALYGGMAAARAVEGSLGGDAGAFAEYSERLVGIHAIYRARHRMYYAAETRWAEQPFWSSRT